MADEREREREREVKKVSRYEPSSNAVTVKNTKISPKYSFKCFRLCQFVTIKKAMGSRDESPLLVKVVVI